MGILERNGGLFTAYNHAICFRMHLMLARMHSICYYHDNKEVNKLFHKVLQNVRNLKDQIMLRLAQIEIFVGEKKYQKSFGKNHRNTRLVGAATTEYWGFAECYFLRISKTNRANPKH
mmetsp:Transcript_8733/g.21410  ORF Transcript_8733/g.21410 Transcript_8733/m.21410 type:complete len:118 (+) Transcript_8733:646-999(+)